jgi:hypothetical protein
MSEEDGSTFLLETFVFLHQLKESRHVEMIREMVLQSVSSLCSILRPGALNIVIFVKI